MIKPSSKNMFGGASFCGSFLLFMFCVCPAFLSFHCSLVVVCWERADLLTRLHVKFSYVFFTFPCDFLGQVWYLIVSTSDLGLLDYFHCFTKLLEKINGCYMFCSYLLFLKARYLRLCMQSISYMHHTDCQPSLNNW